MNIQKVGEFSFIGNGKVYGTQVSAKNTTSEINKQVSAKEDIQEMNKPVAVKEAMPELKDKDIVIKVDISKEGLEALRKQVQEMPGRIDFEKEMRFREILPKLQMDPAGTLYEDMRSTWQDDLDEIKEWQGHYGLEDIVTATMKSYAGQYHKLVQGHEDGSRDIYVSDSLEEYHKVGLEEDLGYLDQAYERAVSGTAMYAGMQEQRWIFRHFFYGEPSLDVDLPKDYRERIKGLMEKAQEEFVQQYESGAFSSEEEMIAAAGKIGSNVLREDQVFYQKMERLFEQIGWAQ